MFSIIDRLSGSEENRRLTVLAMVGGACYLLLAARLFQLQVLQGAEMFRLAEKNRTQIIPLAAPRGRVMDRHGEVLLDNAPRFSLYYSNLSVQRRESQRIEQEVTALFPDQAALLAKRFTEARQTGKMTRILAGLPREKSLGLVERKISWPGMQVVVEPQRRVRFGAVGSHLLGYVDEVNPRDLKKQREELRLGQFIGRSGVEKIYDADLRGIDGGLQFEMDAKGRHLEEMQRLPAQSGRDLVLTVDHRLQEAAVRGLEATLSRRGAVVAVDPRDGAILALVSRPGFDPTGDMGRTLTDPTLPLFNRVLQGTYPPGSVFKAVSAAAALEAGWDVRRVINCEGIFPLGTRDFRCWKRHGPMDFMDGMAWSCDTYYYNMGLRVGPDAIEALARAFGLGQKTGIDLPSEAAGTLPGRPWKQKVMKQPWYDGDTLNFSIGQGFLLVTPLQSAMMVAAVANEGTLWRPRVAARIQNPSGEVLRVFPPEVLHRIPLKEKTWKTVKKSMEEVVRRGTGGGAFRPDILIGGKTGTAQNPHGDDHAWFAAYAGLPGEIPSIVILAFVENGGHGSDAALPVVREVLKEAFPPLAPPVPAVPKISVPAVPVPAHG
jgi:penicillin-binding protein 2